MLFDYYVDLSSTNAGVVLVNGNDVIVTSWNFSKFKKKSKIKTEWQLEKLKYISWYIHSFVDKYPPKSLTMEGIFINRNFVASSETLMKLHGLLIEIFIDFPISYVAPASIKKNITGKGNSNKEDVKKTVCKLLNLELNVLNMDESDALALMINQLENQGKSINELCIQHN